MVPALSSWGTLLVRYENASFGVVRCGDVVKRDVNVFAFRSTVFDQHRGDALGDFALHLRRATFDPGNLHMGHVSSSLERAIPKILDAKLRHSSEPYGSRAPWNSPVAARKA